LDLVEEERKLARVIIEACKEWLQKRHNAKVNTKQLQKGDPILPKATQARSNPAEGKLVAP